jgi:hypothetical protein
MSTHGTMPALMAFAPSLDKAYSRALSVYLPESQNPRHRVRAADGMAWMIDDRGSWRGRTRILYKRRRDGAITTGRRVR